MAAFDWPALRMAGLRGLGLTPDVFWALTPVELMVMLGAGSGAEALSRAGFEALMQSYPDGQFGAGYAPQEESGDG
ncbi:phage tail assembly chaperone [Shimia sp. R11_0]|uniref:rcc01693 family protein n=1 Tax=Shimia sp. R11_0 TaxID=2821096 RepID=UPI001ADD27C3|nr:rcc01693 family protein [Shimia sp. R11_0]MBO9479322.1 phage tail assembly chaperone [Shimia sp. R11_0]